MPTAPSIATRRLPGIDVIKALACLMIVAHHLAFYGPMSDVVQQAAPALVAWFYRYGRMAVQVFLVVGGFLAAASLAPQGSAVSAQPWRLILRRYQRLMPPYLVALAVSVLVAALLRPWFANPSLPAAPGLFQLLSHVLLLQDVLGQEALSAGVWYVAIDFQLFVLSVLLFTAARRVVLWRVAPGRLGVAMVWLLAVASLLAFNLQPRFDATALYFFGAYALGMMAFWAASSRRSWPWLLAIVALGVAALAFDFRGRIAVALVTALLLVWLQRGATRIVWPDARGLKQIGRMSYSVFLIHFPVCLAVNAVVSHFWPVSLAANVLGLFGALGLSLVAGALLYRFVEARRRPAAAVPAVTVPGLLLK